jgi:hypothetical protein
MASRPSMRRSPHEREILGAVSEGAKLEELLRCPKWTVEDVGQVMSRYGLVAGEDGRLVRKRTIDDLLTLAQHSTSPHVRRRAAEAVDRLRALKEAIEGERAELIDEGERAKQREAVERWIDWLTDAMAAARDERRRLRPRTAVKRS